MKKVFDLMYVIEEFNFQNTSFYTVINGDGICLVDKESFDNVLNLNNHKDIIEKETITVDMFLPCLHFMFKHYKEHIIKNDGCYNETIEEANNLLVQLFNENFGKFFPEVNFANE